MTSFKTRVIGAVILVSLAVIFVPMLFKSPSAPPPQPAVSDGAKSGERPLRNQGGESGDGTRFSQRLEVPDAPDIPEFTIEKPVEPQLRERKVEADASDFGDGEVSEASTDPASVEPPIESVDSSSSTPQSTLPQAQPVMPAQEPVAKSAPSPADKTSAAPVQSAAGSAGEARFGEAWTIQIGAFSDRSRAQKISVELQQTGTAAYLQDIKTTSGVDMVRVYAGPMLARESAEKLKSTLDSKYGVNSLIMRYRPVQP